MMRRSLSLLTAASTATLFAACAGGGVPSDEAQDPGFIDGKADGPGTGGDTAEVALPALAKRYALAMKSTIEAQEDGEDETTVATTVVTALVTVLGTDDPAIHDLEIGLCDVDLPEIGGRKPTVEAAALRKSTPASARAQLAVVPAEIDDTGAETAPAKIALVSERTALFLGIDPDDPTAELPEDDDDPRVHDLDEDGKPGLTIKVSGFKIYAGIRAKFGLDGAVAADGSIGGEAGLEIDLKVFGDSIPFVNAANELDEAAENTEILSESHIFSLTPVTDEGDAFGCEQLPSAASHVAPPAEG